jgi:hypothetical protein
METRTNAINSSLMIAGAVILLGVIAWVTYAISEPRIPNTGGVATSTDDALNASQSTDELIGTTTNTELVDPVPSDHTEDGSIE